MTDNKLKIIGEGIVGAATIAFTVLLSPILRRTYSRWGATAEETHQIMPGDDLVNHPGADLACAITIAAPAAQVWPWFAQLGCQRAGWYSYDLLDNGGAPSAAIRREVSPFPQAISSTACPFSPTAFANFK